MSFDDCAWSWIWGEELGRSCEFFLIFRMKLANGVGSREWALWET